MLKFPPTDLRLPPTDRDCPCVDCLDGVPPRDPRDSRGNPNPTAGDLHEMNLHAEYLENDYVWLLCGRHWIHQGCAKKNFFVFAAKNPYVAMYRLPCWLCGQMDAHRAQLAEFFGTCKPWNGETFPSDAVAGNSLPGSPTEDERMPMTPPDYSGDEDASETSEGAMDEISEAFGALEAILAPPDANAKGKGKANGKDNAKAKGKANRDPRVCPVGPKRKRKPNASVIINCDWEQHLSLQEVKRRRY